MKRRGFFATTIGAGLALLGIGGSSKVNDWQTRSTLSDHNHSDPELGGWNITLEGSAPTSVWVAWNPRRNIKLTHVSWRCLSRQIMIYNRVDDRDITRRWFLPGTHRLE